MRGTDSGFTLMETLVALVVFTGVVIALERSTAMGWRGIRLARSDSAALGLARAKLAAFGIENDLAEDKELTGEDNGLQWRIAARKYAQPGAATNAGRPGFDQPSRIVPYWVTVTVSWRDRPMGPARSVELTTLKLEAAP